jgi:hypothetical protein
MVYMIESQIAHVIDALRLMRDRGAETIEVRPEAQARSNAELAVPRAAPAAARLTLPAS